MQRYKCSGTSAAREASQTGVLPARAVQAGAVQAAALHGRLAWQLGAELAAQQMGASQLLVGHCCHCCRSNL